MTISQIIDALIEKNLADIIKLRHEIHQEPEIHFNEFKTRAKIDAAIKALNLDIKEPLLGTDLIAELNVGATKSILLRADIDALPIHEETEVFYKSKIPGMMHACGHDGHTSIMVATAKVLSELKDQLKVNVRFVFQPAEEMQCGGAQLVNAGACEGVEAAFALHGWPGLPVNSISTKSGALFAAADFYRMTVEGIGGHAAMPELNANPIPVAAELALDIQKLNDELNLENGSIISLSKFHGGSASNVTPDKVIIEGTIRYLESGIDDRVKQELGALASRFSKGSFKVTSFYQSLYNQPVINDVEKTEYFKKTIQENMPDCYIEADKPTMCAEDFAFYLKAVPGTMFWLGLGEDWPGLHTNKFDFNDRTIPLAVKTFSLLALNYE